MAGDVQREGSREGQGLHGVRQRGYFWCCMHIVLVPIFELYCLLGWFGLLCSLLFANVTRTRPWWESSPCGKTFGGGIRMRGLPGSQGQAGRSLQRDSSRTETLQSGVKMIKSGKV